MPYVGQGILDRPSGMDPAPVAAKPLQRFGFQPPAIWRILGCHEAKSYQGHRFWIMGKNLDISGTRAFLVNGDDEEHELTIVDQRREFLEVEVPLDMPTGLYPRIRVRSTGGISTVKGNFHASSTYRYAGITVGAAFDDWLGIGQDFARGFANHWQRIYNVLDGKIYTRSTKTGALTDTGSTISGWTAGPTRAYSASGNEGSEGSGDWGANLRAAILAAQATDGIVYLPAGHYQCDFTGARQRLEINVSAKNVLIMGESIERTSIVWGHDFGVASASPAPTVNDSLWLGSATGNLGNLVLHNLQFSCKAQNNTPTTTFRLFSSRYFTNVGLINVGFVGYRYAWMVGDTLFVTARRVRAGTIPNDGAGVTSAFSPGAKDGAVFDECDIVLNGEGRFEGMKRSEDCVMRRCNIVRNNTTRFGTKSNGEGGGIETSYVTGCLVYDSRSFTVGGAYITAGSEEDLMTQYGGSTDDRYQVTVGSQPDGDTIRCASHALIRVLGSPTGGTFRLTFGGNETANLAHNATAAQVQAALEALASVGAGKVTVDGSDISSVDGLRIVYAQDRVGVTTATSVALTGGSGPSVAVQAGANPFDASFPAWNSTPGRQKYIAYVLDGPCAGEWRHVVAFTESTPSVSGYDTITLDPETEWSQSIVGSRVWVTAPPNIYHVYVDNWLGGHSTTTDFYDGALHAQIRRNVYDGCQSRMRVGARGNQRMDLTHDYAFEHNHFRSNGLSIAGLLFYVFRESTVVRMPKIGRHISIQGNTMDLGVERRNSASANAANGGFFRRVNATTFGDICDESTITWSGNLINGVEMTSADSLTLPPDQVMPVLGIGTRPGGTREQDTYGSDRYWAYLASSASTPVDARDIQYMLDRLPAGARIVLPQYVYGDLVFPVRDGYTVEGQPTGGTEVFGSGTLGSATFGLTYDIAAGSYAEGAINLTATTAVPAGWYWLESPVEGVQSSGRLIAREMVEVVSAGTAVEIRRPLGQAWAGDTDGDLRLRAIAGGVASDVTFRNIRFTGVRASDGTMNGLNLYHTVRPRLINVSAVKWWEAGIRLEGSIDPVISNMLAEEGGIADPTGTGTGYGLVLDFTAGATVSGGATFGDTRYGVSLGRNNLDAVIGAGVTVNSPIQNNILDEHGGNSKRCRFLGCDAPDHDVAFGNYTHQGGSQSARMEGTHNVRDIYVIGPVRDLRLEGTINCRRILVLSTLDDVLQNVQETPSYAQDLYLGSGVTAESGMSGVDAGPLLLKGYSGSHGGRVTGFQSFATLRQTYAGWEPVVEVYSNDIDGPMDMTLGGTIEQTNAANNQPAITIWGAAVAHAINIVLSADVVREVGRGTGKVLLKDTDGSNLDLTYSGTINGLDMEEADFSAAGASYTPAFP